MSSECERPPAVPPNAPQPKRLATPALPPKADPAARPLYETAVAPPPPKSPPPKSPSAAVSQQQLHDPVSQLTSVFDSLNAAGSMAEKQAERTRLVKLSVPAAYYRLGTETYKANLGRDAFVVQYAAVDALREKLDALGQAGPLAASPDNLALQSRAIAKAQADVAQRLLLQEPYRQAVIQLGKSAYKKRRELALPDRIVAEIDVLLEQVSASEAVLLEEPERKPAWKPFDWSNWSKRAKMLWTVGSLAVACLVVGGIVVLATLPSDTPIRRSIAEGNRLWDAGDKAAAVDKYLPLLGNDEVFDDDLQKIEPAIFARVIDHTASTDNTDLAVKLLKKAYDRNILPPLQNPQARALSSRMLADFHEQRGKSQQRRESDEGRNIEAALKPFGNVRRTEDILHAYPVGYKDE